MSTTIKTFAPGTEVPLRELLGLTDSSALDGVTSILVRDRLLTPNTTNQSGSYHTDAGGYLQDKDGITIPINSIQTIPVADIGDWSFVLDSTTSSGTLFSSEIGFNLVFDSGTTSGSSAVFAIPSTESFLVTDTFRDPMGDGSLTPQKDGDGYYVAQNYDIEGPASVGGSQHLGIDWNGELLGNTDIGYPIFSAANGIVVHADTNNAFGNHVVVSHRLSAGEIVHSLYAHLEPDTVSVGDVLAIGDQVGTLGLSGATGGVAHLHFEMTTEDVLPTEQDGYEPSGPPDGWLNPYSFIDDHWWQSLSVSETSPNDSSTGVLQANEPIAAGEETPVLPDDSADRDRIKISVEGGRTYEIRLSGETVDGNAAISNGFFSVRKLNTTTGNFETVANTKPPSEDQNGSVETFLWTAPDTGDYYIVVGGGGDDYETVSGGYRLSLTDVLHAEDEVPWPEAPDLTAFDWDLSGVDAQGNTFEGDLVFEIQDPSQSGYTLGGYFDWVANGTIEFRVLFDGLLENDGDILFENTRLEAPVQGISAANYWATFNADFTQLIGNSGENNTIPLNWQADRVNPKDPPETLSKVLIVGTFGRVYMANGDGTEVELVADYTINFTDIAVTADGRVFATTFDQLLELDLGAQDSVVVANFDAPANGLATDAEGSVYVSYSSARPFIDVFDPYNVEDSLRSISVPSGEFSAGDVHVSDGRIFLATTSERVMTFDSNSGQLLSSVYHGLANVWGLHLDGDVFGYSGDDIYRINPESGVSNFVGSLDFGITVRGAATFPLPFDVADAGNNSLRGSAGNDSIDGLGGNDSIEGLAGNDLIDGGAGIDTAIYSGSQSSYTLTLSPTATTVTDRRADGNGTDTLIDMEFLDFDSGDFDLNQFGGTTGLSEQNFESFIELYIAYFNRAPDAIGLNFWGTAFANGTSLEEMAALFAPQDETLETYPPGTSNEDFATSVYNNVLGRDPDLDGFNFWVGQLDEGNFSRDQFILEVLQGVQNGSPDRDYLDNKVDIGAYFAVHKGMSDVDNAEDAMAVFGDQDTSDIDGAVDAIDNFHTDALDPNGGEFLMQVVGVLDDPFAMA